MNEFSNVVITSKTQQISLAFGALAVIVTVSVLGIGRVAEAQSTTSPKLYIYQGVISISPAAGQVMELGANGTTIATNGNIALRPSNGTVTFGPANAIDEGGELDLQGASSSYPTWGIDSYVDLFATPDVVSYLRFYHGASVPLKVGNDGKTSINGQLCFGAGLGDCISNWSSVGGGVDTLSSLLSPINSGNTSMTPVVLGQGSGPVTATARFDISTTSSAFNAYPSLNAVSAHSSVVSDPKGAAIRAENPNGGWAGYFSGRVGVFQPGASDPGFADATVVRLSGDHTFQSSQGVLNVTNLRPSSYAARFVGAVEITGSGGRVPGAASTGVDADAALDIFNSTSTEVFRATSPSLNGAAIWAQAGNPYTNGMVTSAFYGQGGAWPSPASDQVGLQYAGFFTGANVVEGVLSIQPYDASDRWGLLIQGMTRRANVAFNGAKQTAEMQVCELSSNTCYGKYVATIGHGTRGGDRATTQLCYESGGAVTCRAMYVSQSGCVGTGSVGLKLGSSSSAARSYFVTPVPQTPSCRGAELGAPYQEYVANAGDSPYRAAPTAQQFCVSGTPTLVAPNYAQDQLHGGCYLVSTSPPAFQAYAVTLPTTELVQTLEIR